LLEVVFVELGIVEAHQIRGQTSQSSNVC
jgi:hypothetical protein